MSVALVAVSCGGGDFTQQPSTGSGGSTASGGTSGDSGNGSGGTTAQDAGLDSSLGGTGGTTESGGFAGTGGTTSTGGMGGAGGMGGTGGMGGSGQGGTGGAACPPFNGCAPADQLPPSCNLCAQHVCAKLPFCCQSGWDAQCALVAHTLGECQCSGLECSAIVSQNPTGACVPTDAYCNPLRPSGTCSSGQCGLSVDLGQMQFACYPIGAQPPCSECNPTTSTNCEAGLSCIDGLCVRLCCEDEDCGANARCNPAILRGSTGGLGICTR